MDGWINAALHLIKCDIPLNECSQRNRSKMVMHTQLIGVLAKIAMVVPMLCCAVLCYHNHVSPISHIQNVKCGLLCANAYNVNLSMNSVVRYVFFPSMIALIASLDVDIDLRLQNTSATPALSHNLFFCSVRKNRISNFDLISTSNYV